MLRHKISTAAWRVLYAAAFVVSTVTVPTACQQRSSPADSDSGAEETNAYRDMLLEKANALAESEMARLAATELVYRNQVETQEFVLPVVGSRTGTVIKMYREFTGYEVIDVVRSDSLLCPIEIAVRYDFDMLGTQPRSFGAPDAETLTRNDFEFDVLWQGNLAHVYQCDREGELLGALLELPRANFYERGATGASGTGADEQAAIPLVEAPQGRGRGR